MHHYAGVIVIRNGLVLLVQVKDYFTQEPRWTLPSGRVEAGESPADGAARELAEESGCVIDAAELELITTVAVRHEGRHLSASWNYLATTTAADLGPNDPDGDVLDARWFERDEAIDAVAGLPYDPIREPVLRFLRTGARDLHWTFEWVDPNATIPSFRWDDPPAHDQPMIRPSQRRPILPNGSALSATSVSTRSAVALAAATTSSG